MRNALRTIVARIARLIFALRYRVEVKGLHEIRARGGTGLLFLPSHLALIDPAILMAVLDPHFHPHPLADEYQISKPVIGQFARLYESRVLPNLERRGKAAAEVTRRVLDGAIEGLRNGENLLFYPSGRLRHGRLEELRAASGTELIVKAAPDARIVLVRQTGLWGSSFSRAYTGELPHMLSGLARGAWLLLLNGLFFMPRRHLLIELAEPGDFPRTASRMEMNAYMEAFFNLRAPRNTYVPYWFWQRGGTRELPEPEVKRIAGNAVAVAEGTRQAVFEELSRLSGKKSLRLEDRLAQDLGLDSLASAELASWIEQEFGHPACTPESLVTVADVVLTASGQGISAGDATLKRASNRWLAGRNRQRTVPADGSKITEVFLNQARRGPGRIVLADQASGEKTYRQLITGLLLIVPILRELPGKYIGIMLPASVGAGLFYVAALFAGKTPVMVNWTTGQRNLTHALDLLGVRTVITAGPLLTKLADLGIDLSTLEDRFLLAENLRGRLSLGAKLTALLRGYLDWSPLRPEAAPDEAVVLFTSGSENLPKAVPLTHTNILTNVRDLLDVIKLTGEDVLIGMLPPFHSFGITVTTVMPLCSGLRTVYHPNPTEAAILARVIEAYRVTILVGTPTFLNGILRAATDEQLAYLRIAVTGAEKCPEPVYRALAQRCPHATVIEGYGITECSPVVSANRLERPVPGSIGLLLPSVEGVVVDLQSGAPVPRGETGMLLVRGPSIFRGYLGYEGESPFVAHDGREWYRTGDLVRQDAEDVLFFEGRLKRFVKLGGEMVSLPAIESVLAPHLGASPEEGPCFAVEAFGSPDMPEIVLFACRPVEREMANAIIRGAGLSALHYIRRVVQVQSIPVLGTGKTDYRGLVESFRTASRAGGAVGA